MKCVTRTVKVKERGICIIRTPGEADRKVVGDFIKICGKDPFTPVKAENDGGSADMWTSLLCSTGASQRDLSVICAWGGKIIAAGCAFYDVKDEKIVCRMMLFVRKAFRGIGVGSELLKELIEFAEDVASDEIITEVSLKDKRSIAFYTDNGFILPDNLHNGNTATLIKALNYSEIGKE